MADSLANPAPRTLANTSARRRLDDIRATSAAVRTGANRALATDGTDDVLTLIVRAGRETNTSQKVMAVDAGCTESMLSEALHGRRNFDIGWLWGQKDAFLLRFFELAMESRRLTPENARALRMARLTELIALLLTEVA